MEAIFQELIRAIEPLVTASREDPFPVGILRLAKQVRCDLGQAMDEEQSQRLSGFAQEISRIYDDFTGTSANLASAIEYRTLLLNLVETVRTLDEVTPALGKRLLEFLVVDFVKREYPFIHDLLLLLGVFSVHQDQESGNASSLVSSGIRLSRFAELLSRPAEALRADYGWGTASFKSDLLLVRVNSVLWFLGLPSSFETHEGLEDEGVLKVALNAKAGDTEIPLGLEIRRLPADGSELPGLTIVLSATTFHQPFNLSDGWVLSLDLTAPVESGYGISLRPASGLKAVGLLGDHSSVKVSLSRSSAGDQKFTILGLSGVTHLEAESLSISIRAELGQETSEVAFETGFSGGELVIGGGEGDSLVQELIRGVSLRIPIDLTLGWSSRTGFYWKGSASLETSIPIHESLGPIKIDTAYLRLSASETGNLELITAVSLAAKLGVAAVSVDHIGLKTILSLGPSPAVSFHFQPPIALGVRIDAGAITGGGFLYFDQENNRYAGWLRLQLREFSLSAFGIVDLRAQPGVPYSFFIVIAATFPPVQLGWGFTLNGVGGLAGIHRTFDEQALQSAVRSDALDTVLFPEHPDADPLSIIDSVESLFPPAHGRYLFGPLILIGWGTPTVLEAKLGFVLEFPEPVRLAILGKIDATLPSDDVKIVDLHLDLLGLIDFAKKTLAIDGHLHDSYIAGYSIGGDMAMRLAWGDPPYFALAIGGFHPQFPVPAGFPTTRRLTVSLISTEDVSLGLEAYLALTSNTAQFGAKAELNASKGGGSIHGTVYIDSLFTFSPFSMRADFGGSVDVRYHGKVIGSIDVQGHVTGPRPWHVWGKASISVWVADVDVPFSVTFGNPEPVSLPPAKTWEMLGPAIADSRNWSSPLPPWSTQVVAPTAAPSSNPSPALFDPAGTFTFRQKVLPFDYTLTRFGAAQPEDADRYEITSLRINKTTITDWSAASDFFAPAQFRQMSESEKLSSGSFETLHSGCQLPNLIGLGDGLGRKVEYETKPESVVPDSAPLYTPTKVFQLAFLSRSATAGAPLMNSGLRKYSPKGSSKPAATVAEETFVVTSSSDGTVRTDIVASSVTASAAQGALSSYLVKHPEEHGDLQIVPAHDVQEGVLEGPA